MLRLDKIKKVYKTSDMEVVALKGVSLSFRKSEFVSILGPSGCGKTTLLNVIGGLDHYDGGDLYILGRSTKEFKDHDWDVYRNHRIGFVFQSYNLIPQSNVQQNVELGLTIAGLTKKEREAKAQKALDLVGLKGLYRKYPNQLSGGQCQRVAIARAIVNDPDIILADEPTGALDSVTSIQVMDILKAISKDRLVIMVTHNPDLAEKYSTRIINLLDGEVVGDSMPYSDEIDLYVRNLSYPNGENGTCFLSQTVIGKQYWDFLRHSMHQFSFRSACCLVAKRAIVEAHGVRFDERFRLGEDTLFVMDCYPLCQSLQVVEGPCYRYDRSEHWAEKYNLSWKEAEQCLSVFMDKYEKLPVKAPELPALMFGLYRIMIDKHERQMHWKWLRSAPVKRYIETQIPEKGWLFGLKYWIKEMCRK